MRVEKRSGGG
uniref:Uncharacterized protein n=1 Tax=Arundo donax TaxID=35708 RepID=A0A0A8ZRK9_ARUDO